MKILWKKFKKTKLSIRLVYIFSFFLFFIGYILLFKSLLLLNNIETIARIIILIVLGILFISYSFFNLILLLLKKHKIIIFLSSITVIISSFCIICSSIIYKVYTIVDNINKENVLYTTNLITLNETNFINDSSFKVGILSNKSDIEGNILPLEHIKNEQLKFNISEYDSTFELLEKLYNKELNGIYITSNYISMYQGYEKYSNIENDVKIVLEYSKEMKNQDYIESTGSVDKPFTVLLMGVDSKYDGLDANAAFNGDTLMLISFNPHTLNATVFSIPRDTYVPIACLNNQSSKINSAASYGTKCVINTIENLMDIKLDYYVKINFKGVVSLVNALNGIDITVPEGIDFCEQDSNRSHAAEALQCIKSGPQHMDGEKALAFARHRKTLIQGDFQRVQHQQLVVEGIANSTKNLKNINDFYKVLDSISRNMDTNMSTGEILNLYNVGKNMFFNNTNNSIINIQKTYLTGYDLTMYVNNLKSNVYTFQYYEQSLEEIKDAIKETLEIKKPDIIKEFNFSINDEYKVPVIGKNYYTVKRNETFPDFTNKSLEYVKSWCEARNIVVNVLNISPGMDGYNQLLLNETVIKQNVKKGELVNKSSITVSVIKHPQINNEEQNTTTVESNNNNLTTTTTSNTETTSTTTTKQITEEENINETNDTSNNFNID